MAGGKQPGMGDKMKKTNFFKSERWDAGIQNKIEAVTAGVNVKNTDDSTLVMLATPVADLALKYYDRRIRAYFSRFGVDIGEEVLSVESIRQKIEAASGLEINDFTSEGLLVAFEKPIARAVSDELGFTVTSVFDQEEFKRQVKEHVLARLIDGEGGGVLKGVALHRLREISSYIKAGLSPGDRRRLLNRAYQRKYRRSNHQTWKGIR